MSFMSNLPAWISASAAIAGAGAAWFASYNGVRTLKQTRADSIGRSRPMVAAEFRDALPSKGTLYLIIRNYGPSVARNVQVSFTPELPAPEPEKTHESVIPFLKTRYAHPISILTPGTELRNVYYSGVPDDGGKFVNWESVPDEVTVTITYQSGDLKQTYTDSYDLDVAVMHGETYSTSSLSTERQVQDIRRALQGTEKKLGEIAGLLRSGAEHKRQPTSPASSTTTRPPIAM